VNTLRTKHLAVIGAGNIGRILLTRLLAAGVPPDNLVVCERDEARANAVASQYGVRPISLNCETACAADAILLTVPPNAVPQLLGVMSKWLQPGQLVISFAAAIAIERLESLLPHGAMVVHIMPNAPSLVGEGMNPVAYGQQVTPEARILVKEILACLGRTIEVRDDQMNWCVGLSGAAMRSLLPVLEGMIKAGVEAGLAEAEARQVAGQVMQGTASLVSNTELSIEQIKAMTPMQTLDEAMVASIYFESARSAKVKIDMLQEKLVQA
jgi:pyrroline-5-carboxylate reductase